MVDDRLTNARRTTLDILIGIDISEKRKEEVWRKIGEKKRGDEGGSTRSGQVR